MNIESGVYIGIGSISAALIAGYVSYINLAKSKEQTITQLRAQWIKEIIDALSQLLAEMELILRIAHAQLMATGQTELNHEDILKLRLDNRPHYESMNRAFSLVRLRLDPSQHKDILDCLDTLYQRFYGQCGNVTEIDDIKSKLAEVTQRLGLSVWEEIGIRRLRSRWLFWTLWLIFALSLCVLCCYAHWWWHWL